MPARDVIGRSIFKALTPEGAEALRQAEREHLEARVKERTAALSVAKEAAEAALNTKGCPA